MVATLILFFPTMSHIRGVIGVWLRRRFSSLPLFPTQRGGLTFYYHLIVMLLTLVVQVSNAGEGQWCRGH